MAGLDNVMGSDGDVSVGLGLDIQIGQAVNDAAALANQLKEVVNDTTTINGLLSDTSSRLGEILDSERSQVSILQEMLSAEQQLRNVGEQRLSSVREVTAQYTQLEQVMARIQLIAANTPMMNVPNYGGGGGLSGYSGFGGGAFGGASLMGSDSPQAQSGPGSIASTPSTVGGSTSMIGGALKGAKDIFEAKTGMNIGKSVLSKAKSIFGKGGATGVAEEGASLGAEEAGAEAIAAPLDVETLGGAAVVAAAVPLLAHFGGDIFHGLGGLFGGGGAAGPTALGAGLAAGIGGGWLGIENLAKAYTGLTGGTGDITAARYVIENETKAALNPTVGLSTINQLRSMGLQAWGAPSAYAGQFEAFGIQANRYHDVDPQTAMAMFTATVVQAQGSVSDLNTALNVLSATATTYGGSFQGMQSVYTTTSGLLASLGVTGSANAVASTDAATSLTRAIASSGLTEAEKKQAIGLLTTNKYNAYSDILGHGITAGAQLFAQNLGSVGGLTPGVQNLQAELYDLGKGPAAGNRINQALFKTLQSVASTAGLTGTPDQIKYALEHDNGAWTRLQQAYSSITGGGQLSSIQEAMAIFGSGALTNGRLAGVPLGNRPNPKTDSWGQYASSHEQISRGGGMVAEVPANQKTIEGYIKADPVLSAILNSKNADKYQVDYKGHAINLEKYLQATQIGRGMEGPEYEGNALQQILNGQMQVREGTTGKFTSAADITGYTGGGQSTSVNPATGNSVVQIDLTTAAKKWLKLLNIPPNVSGSN